MTPSDGGGGSMDDPARAARLEDDNRRLNAEVVELQGRVHTLASRHAELEAAERELAERLSAVQLECANLMNLCVASDRLYGASDADDVVRGLEEILVNLLGADEIAVFELPGEGHAPALLSCHAMDEGRARALRIDEGRMGAAVRDGRVFVNPQPNADGTGKESDGGVVACAPLRRDGRVAALAVVLRMLPQKPRLTDNDVSLLDHLALHAAIALHSKRAAQP